VRYTEKNENEKMGLPSKELRLNKSAHKGSKKPHSGATTVLSVVNLGFGGKSKPKVCKKGHFAQTFLSIVTNIFFKASK
jgi:hypothetical protein